MGNNQVICFGEVLWDIFPDRSVIGGAPLNVAMRLHTLGAHATVVSKVGADTLGQDLQRYLTEAGFPQDFIQVDPELPTGTVSIQLDETGTATYEIHQPVAWDTIVMTEELVAAVKEAPIFLFGSLAARGGMNRNTLRNLLAVANIKIFDINLRPPHYHVSMVYEMMQQSDMVKLNDDELFEVCDALGCQETDMNREVLWLQAITKAKTICVTRGDAGALLLHKGVFYEHQGYDVKVSDTVGAGDSFLATLVYYLFLKHTSADYALSAACGMGALVASKPGANCIVSEEELQFFMAD